MHFSTAKAGSCDVDPNPYKVRQDSLLAHAGRDLKQASTKDLATSFVERAGNLRSVNI